MGTSAHKFPPGITDHAVERWIERVDRQASRGDAWRDIYVMATQGSRSVRARRWMREAARAEARRAELLAATTGSKAEDLSRPTVYIYHVDRPGVALVVSRDETGEERIVTVVVRAVSKARRERSPLMRTQTGAASRRRGADRRQRLNELEAEYGADEYLGPIRGV